MKKQRSLDGEVERGGKAGTTASLRSTASSASWVSTESYQSGLSHQSAHTDSNASFVVEVCIKFLFPFLEKKYLHMFNNCVSFQDETMDKSVTETYMGEWKNDKRCGFGIAERSDGLKYEGEWFNNKKYGYGVTTFKDGVKEEGKYKNNVLITSQKKKHLFLIRSAKFRERIDAAVYAAQRASKLALQKADIAISRTATARGEAELADAAAAAAQEESDVALAIAKQFAPDFQQPVIHKSKGTFLKTKLNENLPNGGSTSLNQHKVIDSVASPSSAGETLYSQPVAPQSSSSADEKPSSNQISTNSIRMSSTSVKADGLSSSSSTRVTNIRRNSQVSGNPPSLSFQQAMSDHFDHYKRPPSRDASVDRSKPGTRLSIGSRQPSVDKTIVTELDKTVQGRFPVRDSTPLSTAANGTITGTSPVYETSNNEGSARKRTPIPDLSGSAQQPKRTESLFVNSNNSKGGGATKGVSYNKTSNF